ncbi:hypothetical protein CBM2626_A10117 [Cupriavidus taiwanensis]|nr:hypothetical protein CBM2626_A10117 [Cupriavidus taiwanensis]
MTIDFGEITRNSVQSQTACEGMQKYALCYR